MKEHTVKLIDGQFSAEKARMMLVEFLDHKINYHKVERFTNQIRYGEEAEFSHKRLEELQADKARLVEWMKSLPEDCAVRIYSSVELKVELLEAK